MTIQEERILFKEAQKAASKYKGKKGISDVELGFKIKNGKLTNKLCLRFKVNKKKQLGLLEKEEIIPKKIGAFSTDVLSDKITKQTIRVEDPKKVVRPLLGGVQIQSGVFQNTQHYCGTMGCYLMIKNYILGLTNYHVLYDELPPNFVIKKYVGKLGVFQNYNQLNKKIGTATRVFNHILDYATFLIMVPVDRNQCINTIPGVLSSFVYPRFGMRVFKMGSKTKLTHGIIDGRSCFNLSEISICIDHNYHKPQDKISESGDSGSIWSISINKVIRPVALHYARGENRYWAKAKTMSSILKSIKNLLNQKNSKL